MNDDPDLELEAASAAVDGLATSDERALVESSPSLQADLERFTDVRRRISDVAVPSAARESAIAAALAAFDELAGEATSRAPAEATNVVPLESRRRRQYRVLLGAAAAVAVLGVGAVALNSGGGDDHDDASTAATIGASTLVESASPEPAAGSGETERVEVPPAEKTDGTPAAADVADTAAADTAAAETQAADDVLDTDAGDAATELPAPADSTPLVIGGPAEVTPAIETPEELLAFATTGLIATEESVADEGAPATEAPDSLPAAPTATTAPATTAATGSTSTGLDPATACAAAETEYVGTVLYRGTPAYVLRVIDSGEVRALSTIDCNVLVSVTP